MAFEDVVEKDSLADYLSRMFKKKEKKEKVSDVVVAHEDVVVQCVFCEEHFKVKDCTKVGKKEICRPCFFRLRNILRFHWDVEEEAFPAVWSIEKRRD